MYSSVSLLLALATIGIATEEVKLQVPDVPPIGTLTLDGSFQGYSMELASYPDIAGNKSSPNKLSIRMLQNLKDITGSPAHIRIGGTTSNHATWVADQEEAIIQNFAVPGADQPANVTLGPNYLQSFKTFPNGTLYTIGVTFDSGKAGSDATVKEAQAFYEGLGDDLFAMEVGNEFDAFPVNRTLPYTSQTYVPEWLNRTAALTARVFNNAPSKKLFQAAAFVPPGTVGNDTSFNTQTVLSLGLLSTGIARTYSMHNYFGVACRPLKPTLATALMNRTALQHTMRYHATSAALTTANGTPYILGETNSIACQGLAGVSDVFGAALWAIDYALYAAAVRVAGIYWHMGTGYRYNAWQATQNGTTAAGPRPLYYGNWFVASALGGADKQVVAILDTSFLAGYAVYGAASASASSSSSSSSSSSASASTRLGKGAQLEGIVLVNMAVYNSSSEGTGEGGRSSVAFELPEGIGGRRTRVSVRRLSAAGAEVKEGMTWAGRTVGLDGSIVGSEVVEQVVGRKVSVRASEAVLVSFE